jgi:glutamine amidotransferase-like uncharacterized protein
LKLSSPALLLLLALSLPAHAAPAGTALVYDGPGVCDDRCDQAASAVAERAGLKIRWVTPEQLRSTDPAELFRDAAVWIQPGGNAIDAAHALRAKGLERIRDYIQDGGAYLGFCAGAFLADKTVNDEETLAGLGIIPVSTFDYPADHGEWGTILPFRWNGQKRSVYFNGGGSFKVPSGMLGVEVFARYADDGLPAAIQTTFGAGRVVVSGPHPEALAWWKDQARREDEDAIDEDGSDFDLAADMLARALGPSRARK